MAEHQSHQQIYEHLMDINKEAFGQELYEVAYHALAAALHCAFLLEPEALLVTVEQRAREQGNWIDTHAAAHPLSSSSASLHGQRSLYTNLVRQTQTKRLLRRHLPPHL
jgi:hypothetical protein